ncbi:AcrR family transcriptional regulator [Peribacillus deserti]|uniref:AcrR family transcriptional regulator n=1 Tax=Peribacillus deserti TaxID=673318 RepID=A0ABS2QKW3_9BACI|nr:forespore capture DNA-binding protein RefZ [Peribacillus deserti]MBM7692906.1 AcrR family transcriptional regulator [Peribacillus deserti]
MSRKNETKEAIIEAALYLFQIKGYHATSVRDISNRAGVNSATISYYFKNKNGLLEYCFTSFLEEYLQLIENHLETIQSCDPAACLKSLVKEILLFQRKNYLAAKFVYSEISFDSSLNREILSTYWTKEKFYLQALMETGIQKGVFRSMSLPIFILQLKGLMSAPLLHAQYSMEVLYQFPQEEYFTMKYLEELYEFIDRNIIDAPKEFPLVLAGEEVVL